ncbi:MAG: DUF6111 family protein [Alphaproteobacteria bacterium]|nr:DUF6111 family protein [Alphaproteobacteria bacterium]
MALFLLRFWPVLIPLLVYAVWMVAVRTKARKAGAPVPHFREGPWFWALVASLGVGVVLLLSFGLSHESVKGEYIPPHMENGRIVPGEVKTP